MRRAKVQLAYYWAAAKSSQSPGPAGSKGSWELKPHFLQHKRRQWRARSAAHREGEGAYAQAPSAQVTQVLLLAFEAKANHGVAGKGGRNTKPLTETLLIKDIPPLPILPWKGETLT